MTRRARENRKLTLVTVLPKTNVLHWKQCATIQYWTKSYLGKSFVTLPLDGEEFSISSQFLGCRSVFSIRFFLPTNRFLALKPERLAIVLEEASPIGLFSFFFRDFSILFRQFGAPVEFQCQTSSSDVVVFFVFLVRFFVHRRELASFVFFFVFEFLSLFLCFYVCVLFRV